MTDSSTVPLLITAREDVLDDALRLAAAAGLELTVADSAAAAVARWARAPLILVGEDMLGALVDRCLPRRPDVLVLSRADPWRDGDSVTRWRLAVELGADHVVELPEAERWLVDRLGDVADGPALEGPQVCVVPGRGGAGASTLACLLAMGSPADALLLDLDPLGGGLDARLGLEDVRGLRWRELSAASGRLSPRALAEALPSAKGKHALVSVVSADRGSASTPTVDAVDALLQAGRRGFGLTVIDCPRVDTDITRLAWSRSRLGVVVVPADLLGAVASASLVASMRQICPDVRIVIRRGRQRALDDEDIARALDVPILGTFDDDKRIRDGEIPATTPSRAIAALIAALAAAAGVAEHPGRRARRAS